MEEQNLDNIRDNIDNIDKKLVEILEARLKLVKEIGLYKLQNALPVYDGIREQRVIERYKSYLNDHVFDEYIEELCCNIMKVSRDVQENQVF